MPTAIELSICIGIGGCVCPNLRSANLIICTRCALINSALNLASAAEAAITRSIVVREYMGMLSLIGSCGCETDPKK